MSRLVLKIIVVQFFEALVIVFATRAFVLGSYKLVALTEVVFITQWFYGRKISFDEEQSRGWKVGYPAYTIGSVAGALVGLYISKFIGG